MTFLTRGLRTFVSRLSFAALLGVLFLPVSTVQAQHLKNYRTTTCDVKSENLKYGIWENTKKKEIRMLSDGLENAMGKVSQKRKEIEKYTWFIEQAQFLYDIHGKEKAIEVLKEIYKTAGLTATEEEFGLGGEAATAVYDAVTSYSDPVSAALFVADQSWTIGTNLAAIYGLGSRLPRRNTLTAIETVLEAHYKHCGNRKKIVEALSITSRTDGYFFDSQDKFLTWTVNRWAEENQGTDLFSFIGPGDLNTNTYFYSSERVEKMVKEETGEIEHLASEVKGKSNEEAEPSIGSVSPDNITGRPTPQRQTIRVIGSGFSQDATLEFYDGTGECDPCSSKDSYLDVVSETIIEYEVATGTDAATWKVQVVDDGKTSNKGKFSVQGGEDGVAPSAPIDLVATPNRPTQKKEFRLNWKNPSDASGVVAAWYKVGSPPSSSTGGTRLQLPIGKPFSVQVSVAGETPVYVWLEDGAGNKSAANVASVTVERDVTSPSVTIKEPIENWSQGEDPHIAQNSTITLEGTASDSQSDIVSVFWLNEATGQSGFGTFDGSNWTLADIPLADGANALGALVLDGAGNIGYDILGVNYDAPGYTLSVSATNGTVEKDPDQESYAEGEEVDLTAKPDGGYEFDEWSGDASGSENPLSITMNSDKSITAEFVEDGGGATDGSDLVIEDLGAKPTEVAAGEAVDLSYTVANRGDEDVFGHTEGDFWSVKYLLSADKSVSSGDRDLGGESYSALAKREPGWEDDVSEDVSIPSDVSQGDNFLLVVADRDDEVSESNENNNVEPVEISVTDGATGGDGPDLVVEDLSVSPSEAAVGEEVEISYTLVNQGNDDADGPWSEEYFLSTDNNLDEEDRNIGGEAHISLARLSAGDENEESDDEAIPDVSPGEYYVLVATDYDDEISESNENNNLESVSLSVVSDNEPPTASDDSDETIQGQPATTDVLANDSDPDGSLDPSTVTVQSGPSSGTASVDGSTGTITYTPNGSFSGTDSYAYTVHDNDGASSNAATVTITVRAGEPFVTTWKTTSANEPITIPTNGDGVGDYDFQVKWGDGTTERITGDDPDPSHKYGSAGTHSVEITGAFPRLFLSDPDVEDPNSNKLQSIDQWGSIQWQSMEGAFAGASNVTSSASDSPVLSDVTDVSSMFQGATAFNGSIGSWDVSRVTDMGQMFQNATSFDQDLGGWDVSNVADFQGFLAGTELSPENYDALLIGWEPLDLVDGLTFDAGQSRYTSEAESARQALIDEEGWTINDEGTVHDTTPPAVPTGLTARSVNQRVQLSWTKTGEDDLAGYRLYRSVGAAPDPSGAPVNSDLLREATFSDVSVDVGRTYRYGVTAVDTAENESALSDDVRVYVRPNRVAVAVTRSFGDASGPGDYRLVALPGAPDTSLAAVVSGDAGSEWQAYRETGGQLQRYGSADGDGFAFQKGQGYWLTSRQDWVLEDSVEVAPLHDSTTAIPLNDGWTVVANPFGKAVAFGALQAANGGDLEPLWPFGGAFSDTTQIFKSAAGGQAYYLFSDPDRDSLYVPHPDFSDGKGRGVARSALSAENESGSAALALSARPVRGEVESPSTIRIGVVEEAEVTSLRAPPGGLEAVSLRIVRGGEEQGEKNQEEHLYMAEQRQAEGEGTTFQVRLTSRTDGPIEIQARGVDSLGGRSAYLLDPSQKEAYDLREQGSVEITPEEGERRFEVAVGTERYVEDERAATLPDEVRLTSYPNPVRRQGTFEYTLPEANEVTLRVHDVLGRQVATLVRDRKQAGLHQVTFETSQLSSGVYFGRLKAGDHRVTRKITVVR